MTEVIIKRVKAPEYLEFVECPKCTGVGTTIYEAFTGVLKRELCDLCTGQGFTMSLATRSALKGILND